jgi:hypothetical protein
MNRKKKNNSLVSTCSVARANNEGVEGGKSSYYSILAARDDIKHI